MHSLFYGFFSVGKNASPPKMPKKKAKLSPSVARALTSKQIFNQISSLYPSMGRDPEDESE